MLEQKKAQISLKLPTLGLVNFFFYCLIIDKYISLTSEIPNLIYFPKNNFLVKLNKTII